MISQTELQQLVIQHIYLFAHEIETNHAYLADQNFNQLTPFALDINSFNNNHFDQNLNINKPESKLNLSQIDHLLNQKIVKGLQQKQKFQFQKRQIWTNQHSESKNSLMKSSNEIKRQTISNEKIRQNNFVGDESRNKINADRSSIKRRPKIFSLCSKVSTNQRKQNYRQSLKAFHPFNFQDSHSLLKLQDKAYSQALPIQSNPQNVKRQNLKRQSKNFKSHQNQFEKTVTNSIQELKKNYIQSNSTFDTNDFVPSPQQLNIMLKSIDEKWQQKNNISKQKNLKSSYRNRLSSNIHYHEVKFFDQIQNYKPHRGSFTPIPAQLFSSWN